MYEVADFAVSPAQLVNLWKGRPVQLSADALKKPNSRVYVHPETAKKIHRATMKGTGCRVCMSQDEILKTGPKGLTGSGRMAGLGWWSDAWDSLKKAAKWVAEKVPEVYHNYVQPAIQSDFYQNEVRPKIREKLEGFAESKPYANYSVPAIEFIGDKTGAFGVKKPKAKCGGRVVQQRQKKPVGGSFKNTGY